MAESTDISHAFIDSNNRCMKCVFVVYDFFPKIMQRIMKESGVSAELLYNRIQSNKALKRVLKMTDHQTLQTLFSDGYTKLDLTLMLKIIAHYSNLFIDPPSRGWSSKPTPSEITIGDDAQRLRQIRNHFHHKSSAELSETDYNEFFANVTAIFERVDRFLHSTEEDSFQLRLKAFKTQIFVATDALKKQYDEERCLEDFFVEETGKNEFKVFKAKSFKTFIEELTDRQDDESWSPATLTFPEISDPMFTKCMNYARKEINKELLNIIVESFTDGSLVMEIAVKTSVLLNDEKLKAELTNLFTRLMTISKNEDIWNTFSSVIIVMSESIATYLDDRPRGSLQLNLKVKNNVLQSDEMLKSQLHKLFVTLESKSNRNKVFLSDKPVVAVIDPGFKDNSQSSMYSYPPLSDSGEVPNMNINETRNQKRDAQVVKEKFPTTVESIHLQLLNKFKVQTGNILTRCCTLHNGLMVLICAIGSSLIRMQDGGSEQSTIEFSLDMDFTDITATNGNCVAVLSLHPQVILIIDVIKEEVVKVIKTKYRPTSITSIARYCLYCTPEKGIVQVDLEDHFKYSEEKHYLHGHAKFPYILADERIVYNDKTTYLNTTIASTDDRICYSDDYFMVKVLDSKYNLKYKCDKLINPPREITIGHGGVVYIIIESNISAIFPGGKTVRRILGKNDGLIRPTCIHYDRYTQQLIVVDEQSVSRYSIQMS